MCFGSFYNDGRGNGNYLEETKPKRPSCLLEVLGHRHFVSFLQQGETARLAGAQDNSSAFPLAFIPPLPSFPPTLPSFLYLLAKFQSCICKFVPLGHLLSLEFSP